MRGAFSRRTLSALLLAERLPRAVRIATRIAAAATASDVARRAAAGLALCTAVSPVALPPALAADSSPAPIVQPAAADRYVQFRLVRPGKDETIHDNLGNVPVEVRLQPPLRAAQGHRLRLRLDDSMLPGAWQQMSFTLSDIDRGTHTLQAVVADAEGRTLIESERVEFHVWRASRLFPSRRQ